MMNGKIKALREQQALSLSDVAQITGLSRVTINRIENGKQKPMPRTIRKLAKAFNVPIDELTSEQARFFESS
jgi:transcriptional regulator with XRE-family HTH domain